MYSFEIFVHKIQNILEAGEVQRRRELHFCNSVDEYCLNKYVLQKVKMFFMILCKISS